MLVLPPPAATVPAVHRWTVRNLPETSGKNFSNLLPGSLWRNFLSRCNIYIYIHKFSVCKSQWYTRIIHLPTGANDWSSCQSTRISVQQPTNTTTTKPGSWRPRRFHLWTSASVRGVYKKMEISIMKISIPIKNNPFKWRIMKFPTNRGLPCLIKNHPYK